MSLLDLLSKALSQGSTANPEPHFDQVASQAAPGMVGDGVAEAFRSDQTEPFPQMVQNLFSRSDSTQQAGLLNKLIQAAGPVALGAAGGVLAKMLKPGQTELTADQASALRPEQVHDIAVAAQNNSPSVMDQVGNFYAEHPTLIKTLGGAALMIVLARMKNRLDKG